MGIKGLWQALQPYVQDGHLSQFKGRRVGVDMYVWLHQAIRHGVELNDDRLWRYFEVQEQAHAAAPCDNHVSQESRDTSGQLTPGSFGTEDDATLTLEELCVVRDRFLDHVVHKLNALRQHGVIPVCVFDGAEMPIKRATNAERRERREANFREALSHLLKNYRRVRQRPGDRRGFDTHATSYTAALECACKAMDISLELAHLVQQVLREEQQVECLVAPYEAEAQMAYLCREGHLWAALSEDSDLIAYFCPCILAKVDVASGRCVVVRPRVCVPAFLQAMAACGMPQRGRRPRPAAKDSAETRTPSASARAEPEPEPAPTLSYESFLLGCIMSGCDYVANLRSIGVKTAFKLVTHARSLPTVLQLLHRQFGFPAEELQSYGRRLLDAFYGFVHHIVYDPRQQRLVNFLPLPQPAQRGTGGAEAGPGRARLTLRVEVVGEMWPDATARAICAEGLFDPNTHRLYQGTFQPCLQAYLRRTRRGQVRLTQFDGFQSQQPARVVLNGARAGKKTTPTTPAAAPLTASSLPYWSSDGQPPGALNSSSQRGAGVGLQKVREGRGFVATRPGPARAVVRSKYFLHAGRLRCLEDWSAGSTPTDGPTPEVEAAVRTSGPETETGGTPLSAAASGSALSLSTSPPATSEFCTPASSASVAASLNEAATQETFSVSCTFSSTTLDVASPETETETETDQPVWHEGAAEGLLLLPSSSSPSSQEFSSLMMPGASGCPFHHPACQTAHSILVPCTYDIDASSGAADAGGRGLLPASKRTRGEVEAKEEQQHNEKEEEDVVDITPSHGASGQTKLLEVPDVVVLRKKLSMRPFRAPRRLRSPAKAPAQEVSSAPSLLGETVSGAASCGIFEQLAYSGRSSSTRLEERDPHKKGRQFCFQSNRWASTEGVSVGPSSEPFSSSSSQTAGVASSSSPPPGSFAALAKVVAGRNQVQRLLRRLPLGTTKRTFYFNEVPSNIQTDLVHLALRRDREAANKPRPNCPSTTTSTSNNNNSSIVTALGRTTESMETTVREAATSPPLTSSTLKLSSSPRTNSEPRVASVEGTPLIRLQQPSFKLSEPALAAALGAAARKRRKRKPRPNNSNKNNDNTSVSWVAEEGHLLLPDRTDREATLDLVVQGKEALKQGGGHVAPFLLRTTHTAPREDYAMLPVLSILLVPVRLLCEETYPKSSKYTHRDNKTTIKTRRRPPPPPTTITKEEITDDDTSIADFFRTHVVYHAGSKQLLYRRPRGRPAAAQNLEEAVVFAQSYVLDPRAALRAAQQLAQIPDCPYRFFLFALRGANTGGGAQLPFWAASQFPSVFTHGVVDVDVDEDQDLDLDATEALDQPHNTHREQETREGNRQPSPQPCQTTSQPFNTAGIWVPATAKRLRVDESSGGGHLWTTQLTAPSATVKDRAANLRRAPDARSLGLPQAFFTSQASGMASKNTRNGLAAAFTAHRRRLLCGATSPTTERTSARPSAHTRRVRRCVLDVMEVHPCLPSSSCVSPTTSPGRTLSQRLHAVLFPPLVDPVALPTRLDLLSTARERVLMPLLCTPRTYLNASRHQPNTRPSLFWTLTELEEELYTAGKAFSNWAHGESLSQLLGVEDGLVLRLGEVGLLLPCLAAFLQAVLLPAFVGFAQAVAARALPCTPATASAIRTHRRAVLRRYRHQPPPTTTREKSNQRVGTSLQVGQQVVVVPIWEFFASPWAGGVGMDFAPADLLRCREYLAGFDQCFDLSGADSTTVAFLHQC